MAAGDERGHAAGAAQVAVALGADGGGVVEARTALAHARGDSQPGGGGAGPGQMARHFGAAPLGGARADAFERAKPREIGVQLGSGAGVRGDLGFELDQFPFQSALHAGEAFGAGRIEPGAGTIAFGLEHRFQIGAPTQECAPSRRRGAGRLPGGPRTGAAKAGDEFGSEPVGLVAAAKAAREVFDAAWIGDVQVMAGGVEFAGGQFAVAAGGFAHGERRGGAELLAPGAQGLEAGLGVVELGVMGALAPEQAGVEFGFGDVEAQAGGEGGEGLRWSPEELELRFGLTQGGVSSP